MQWKGENELDSDDDIGWDNLPDNEPPSTKAPANQPTELMTKQQLMQLSNAALKNLLKERGLNRNGSKAVMVQRLLTGFPRVRAVPRNMNPLLAEEEDEERLKVFPCIARWKELLTSEEQVTEPTMPELWNSTMCAAKGGEKNYNSERKNKSCCAGG